MHTLPPLPTPRNNTAPAASLRRRLAALLLLVAVLGLHVWLLNGGPQRLGAPAQTAIPKPRGHISITLRQPPAAATAAEPAAAASPEAATAATGAVQAAPTTLAFATLATPAAPAAPAFPAAPAIPAAPGTATPTDAGADADTNNTTTTPDANLRPVPTYATRAPPPATLHYTLQRGVQVAPARLVWDTDGNHYALTLAAEGDRGSLMQGLGAVSRGSFDSAGIAPERFVNRRRGRDQRAVNFARDGGQLRFSAQTQEAALQPGMQDRVSWMLQLAAVLEANPVLAEPGIRIAMWVAGTRGAPQVWDFEVQPSAAEAGQPPGLLHLRRDAQRPHDLQVDAWLDPARHHLPWRVRLSAPPGGWASDLRLATAAETRP